MHAREERWLLVGKEKDNHLFCQLTKKAMPGSEPFYADFHMRDGTREGRWREENMTRIGYMDSYVKVILYILLCFASFYLNLVILSLLSLNEYLFKFP